MKMYTFKAAFLLLFVIIALDNTLALSCIPCDKSECKDLVCKGGLVKDACGCCNVCALQRGETCGGPFNIIGLCDKGLMCHKKTVKGQFAFNQKGICVEARCPPVCLIFCPYGNVLDKNGCKICRCKPKPKYDCLSPPKPGLCLAYIPRWYFSVKHRSCRKFIYGGCGGNRNNYLSKEQCERKCGAKPDCRSYPEVGPCKARFTRWYYSVKLGSCRKFTYGGCKGNSNNYKTLSECLNTCRHQYANDPPFQKLCGGKYYTPKESFCHHGKIYSYKIFGRCGGRIFKWKVSFCHGGRVYLYKFYGQCGPVVYKYSQHYCTIHGIHPWN